MRTQIIQWISRVLTLCVFGPLCANFASRVRSIDGSERASFLVSQSMGSGAAVLAAILGIVVVVGVVIAKLTTRREAMLNMAFMFGWVAWTSGRMGDLFRTQQGGFVQLAIEAGLIGIAVMVVLRVSSNFKGDDETPTMVDCSGMFRGASLMAIGAAMVAAIASAWAFGQTDLSGQSLWAAFAGGIVAGLVGAMVLRSQEQVGDDRSISMIPMIFGVLLAGVVAPLIGMAVPGSGKLLESLASGSMPGWLTVSPVSWAVGALLGVPIGWGWLESTVAMQESQAQAA
ncbi:MAG: hypothetical protein JKY96_03350 [Phycisphaerales bacterium]|nr:hypothetical protein [Phycisphaerales bacterium]